MRKKNERRGNIVYFKNTKKVSLQINGNVAKLQRLSEGYFKILRKKDKSDREDNATSTRWKANKEKNDHNYQAYPYHLTHTNGYTRYRLSIRRCGKTS